MSVPHTMSHLPPQPQLSHQRPQFQTSNPNQQLEYSATNGRANSFNGPSPSAHSTYSTPSPQQYAVNHNQGPPLKRQRLSPEVQSPFPNGQYPQANTPRIQSPTGSSLASGTPAPTSRPGLMPPPQRPAEKEGPDRSYDDILAGTGIDLEEEARSLARHDYYGPPTSSFQTASGSFGSYQSNSFGQNNTSTDTSLSNGLQSTPIDPAEQLKRVHERADWEAARHKQHPLWEMFLMGGTLNDKIKKFSHEEHLVEQQAGVLVNTQRTGPPPRVRVNGLEGASRVIDQGQSILDTKDKAERLSEAMKLISLAARTRLIGLLSASNGLAVERQSNAKGRIPEDWADVAVASSHTDDNRQGASSPAGSTSLKRLRSQADSDMGENSNQKPVEESFESFMQTSRAAEEARVKRRAQRKAKSGEGKDGDASTDATAEALAAAMDSEKKTTKKERKAAESKFSEQQQHKNANDAARMATSSILGRTFGKKGKSYSWMTGGGGGGGGGAGGLGAGAGPGSVTPSAVSMSIGTSTAATPASSTPVTERGPVIPRGRRFREFDDQEDSRVQARDILLVLETDGQAAKSLVKGYSSLIEGKETS